jgi:hypothetical protein
VACHVERGVVPGIVTLLSRRGEVHDGAIGTKAFGGSDSMRRDTMFRVASVTKPIVAAAAMILVEECALMLDEPVDPWGIQSILHCNGTSRVLSLPSRMRKTSPDLFLLSKDLNQILRLKSDFRQGVCSPHDVS